MKQNFINLSTFQKSTLFVFVSGVLISTPALSQTVPPDEYPQVGVLPSGLYSVDKLETIDRVSGNVMYSIPLASLPKVGPGSPFQLKLTYNSSNLAAYYTSRSDPREPYPPPKI